MWNEEYTIDKEPIYTEEGVKSIHCSVDGEIKEGFERGYKAGYNDAEYEAKLMAGEIAIEEITNEDFESV